jgi:hypothetical protein
MSALVADVAAGTVLAALLIACAAHLSRPRTLPRALAAHRVVPGPAVVAAVVTASEGLLGGAGAVGLVRSDGQDVLTAALAGGAGLLALFGSYSWYVLATGRAGPCGCSRVPLPMTGWVVARAFALAGLALVALVLADPVAPTARPAADLVVALLAAATFTCLLWQLPAAMHYPGTTQPTTQPSSPTRAGGAVVHE